jgi:hypothetical protein
VLARDTRSSGKRNETEIPSLVAGRAVVQVKVRVANLAVVGAIPVVLRLEVDDSHSRSAYPDISRVTQAEVCVEFLLGSICNGIVREKTLGHSLRLASTPSDGPSAQAFGFLVGQVELTDSPACVSESDSHRCASAVRNFLAAPV